ncbi:MAG: hypothetical protein A2086_13085 [Spirochaetes bacterium GWD1_27_9]|nr:MAG: hypothetical protein A2Z98_07645 [Spirochaetes bacterium GWB1_27_13]OHD43595.1 MAG: hypothetical protein A2086_13085 [Spirochaetes bacterium GWD1_27_9]
MIKIRAYEHTDRYIFEKLVREFYEERKVKPPTSDQLFETVGFFNSYPQCGKIFMILYKEEFVGYCIVLSMWKNQFSNILYLIDELYIKKKHEKQKLEIDLIEYLIKYEKIHGISIRFDNLNFRSKRTFKSIKFKRDKNDLYLKMIEV